MADRPTLSAASRELTGSKVARLRREGRLPGVVYGHGRESTSVTVDTHELELLRRKTAGSALVDLSIDGKRSVPVIIHSVQIDPIHHRPLHVDLFAVRMSEELVVEVPLVGTGEAPAEKLGGTLMHQLNSIKVKALPAKLPESLHYDLGALVDYDTVVTVADLVLPDGVSLGNADLTEVVAKVLPPRVHEQPSEGEAPESEAPAASEGEAAGA